MATAVLTTPAVATEVWLGAPGAQDGLFVGQEIEVGLHLWSADAIPAGEVDLSLRWGDERSRTDWLGALQLLELPSAVDPDVALTLGSDCAGALAANVGACRLSLGLLSPRPAGSSVSLATMRFRYVWEPAPGWEQCVLGLDPGCIPAGQSVAVDFADVVVFGETTGIARSGLETGTFGEPGVRPVPEPGAAILLGLGLMGLGSGRRRGPARGARAAGRQP